MATGQILTTTGSKRLSVVYGPRNASCEIVTYGGVADRQVYDQTEAAYSPDYTLTPLTLFPRCTVSSADTAGDSEVNAGLTNIKWYEMTYDASKKTWSAGRVITTGTDYEVIQQATEDGLVRGMLVVKKNATTVSPIRLVFEADYVETATGASFHFKRSRTVIADDNSSPSPVLSVDCCPGETWNPLRDGDNRTVTAQLTVGSKDVTDADSAAYFWYRKTNKENGSYTLTELSADDNDVESIKTKTVTADGKQLTFQGNVIVINRDFIGDGEDFVCKAIYRGETGLAEGDSPADADPRKDFSIIRQIPPLKEPVIDKLGIGAEEGQTVFRPVCHLFDNIGEIPNPEDVLSIEWLVRKKGGTEFVKVAEGAAPRLEFTEDMTYQVNIIDRGGSPVRYYVASQDTDNPSPLLTNVLTTASVQTLQDMYRPFLINHTENTGELMPADELRRNNWLRYTDGRFAPVVGITEEMRAQCDVALYLDAAHSEKYCEAGEFDAERFYDKYGMTQKLYDAAGAEIGHILRPWETTSKDYSVKIGATGDNWLLDDYSETDGRMYKGILKSDRAVAGLKPKKLAPTLMSPTTDTTVKGSDGLHRFRSFFFLYNPDDNNTQGVKGTNTNIDVFVGDGGYPRHSDVNQLSSVDYARNNNPDRSRSYPFSEAGFHAYNMFVTAHELLYGTNYINDPDNLFSSGTSSNDGCSNADQWRKYGGLRYNSDADNTLRYSAMSNSACEIYINASGGKVGTAPTAFINGEAPKWLCCEAQIALSFAAELGIGEDTEYEVYGRTYRYATPGKAKGIAEGYMNARVYRQVDADYSGYTKAGAATTYHLSIMLRNGIMDGMMTSGDVFHYRGGGYEMVSTVIAKQAETRTGYPTDIYLETDQKKFDNDKTVTKDNLGTFGFESEYEKIAHIDKTTLGWMKKRTGYANHMLTTGGSKATYVTGYSNNDNYFSDTINQRVRRCCRCGGAANWPICGSRSVLAALAVSSGYRAYGGSAQCLFYRRS